MWLVLISFVFMVLYNNVFYNVLLVVGGFMKKRKIILIMFIFLLFLIGCNKKEDTFCDKFKCYYTSKTGSVTMMDTQRDECPIISQELDLFFVECESRLGDK